MIFNELIASSGGGGAKVAEWSSTGGGNVATSITFSGIDAEPTDWLLLCVGPPNIEDYFQAFGSTYYFVSAAKEGNNIYSTAMYIYNNTTRLYGRTNYITATYYNDTKEYNLRSTTSGWDFMVTSMNYRAPVTYLLCYKTN